MTLEETIKHCEENEEKAKRMTEYFERPNKAKGSGNKYNVCRKRVDECEALIGWLKELKARREKDEWLKNILDTDDDEVL